MNFHNYQQTILFNPDNVQDGETYQKYVSALHNFNVSRDKAAVLSERAYQAWDKAAIKAAAQPKPKVKSKPFAYSVSEPQNKTLVNTPPFEITKENAGSLVNSQSDYKLLVTKVNQTNFSFAQKYQIFEAGKQAVKQAEQEQEAAKEAARLRRFKGE